MEEVDAFRQAVRDTFLGVREPPLTADEVRCKKFSTTRLRPGYDEEGVDAFLEEVEARLPIRCAECGAPVAELIQVCAECGAPPVGRRSVAADTAAGSPGSDVSDALAGRRRRRVVQLAGVGILAVVAVTAVILASSSGHQPASTHRIAHNDPLRQSLLMRLRPPGTTSATTNYLLGTDDLGRDLLARILYGARASLMVATLSVSVSLLVGTILGLLAGWFRGLTAILVMRFVDTMLSIPPSCSPCSPSPCWGRASSHWCWYSA